MFDGKIIFITGGTGTLGSLFVEEILKSSCRKIIVFSRDEDKHFQMQNTFNDDRLEFIIGDIRNYQLLCSSLVDVDIVIHTAAIKQVPIAEKNPIEATLTNIIGTNNIISASILCKVKKVVYISSDKAVYPANCMGMSKGIAERLVKSNRAKETDIVAIRLGNVLGSRGSIIPLWMKQVKNGGPLTLTNGEMTRFIMTKSDVYELLLHSINCGKNGEIIVAPMSVCKISDLAISFCEHFNLEFSKDFKIIGLRPGEKLYEELFSQEDLDFVYYNDSYFHISNIRQSNRLHIFCSSADYNPITVSEITHILESSNIYNNRGKELCLSILH